MFACGQGFEAQFDHALICPDEAPRSELDAAEIAGHDRGKLTDPAVQQHGEHGAARRAVRFLTAHLINLVNELVLLEIWLWAGVPKLYAPLCVFLVAFPVNFLMVRFALRGRLKS